MIEFYENSSAADRDGWFITKDGDESAYSSLVGIPISAINASEFIDYILSIETAYLHLDCPVVNSSWSYLPTTDSVTGGGAYMWWFDNAVQRAQTDANDLTPFNFTYMDWGRDTISNCTIKTTYVKVEISCPTSSTCAASKLRRSQLTHPPPNYTQLDLPSYAGYGNWYLFASDFVTSATSHAKTPTIVQNYLTDPDNPAGGGLSDAAVPVSNELYALRLNQQINAYWTCINGLYVISGGIAPETLNASTVLT